MGLGAGIIGLTLMLFFRPLPETCNPYRANAESRPHEIVVGYPCQEIGYNSTGAPDDRVAGR